MDEPGRFNLVSNVILFFILLGLAAICVVVAHPVVTNSGFKPLEKHDTAEPPAENIRPDSSTK